jgi:predicted transcriptional regulator
MKTKAQFLKKLFIALGIIMLLFAISDMTTRGATIGQAAKNVKIQDAEGKEAVIPYLGTRVISIFYNDPDTADIGDPLADAIKDKKYPEQKYVGIGIANCKDAPMKPDSIIRWVLRMKIKKYKSTMLADVDSSVKKAWDLGDCNDTCVVIIIGKDGRVKYVTSIKNKDQGKSKIAEVLAVLDREVLR